MTKVREFLRKHGLFTLLIIAILGARWSLAAPYMIPSGSMEPTLRIGDRLLVNKAAFDLVLPFTDFSILRTGEPSPGDIILFDSPENRWDTLIKRLIAGPGDEVHVKDGFIWVNGEPLPGTEEGVEALRSATEAVFFYKETSGERTHEVKRDLSAGREHELSLTVPDGSYFVMGDNRDNSNDSRFIGLIPRRFLRGKAVRHLFRFSLDEPFPWVSFDRSLSEP